MKAYFDDARFQIIVEGTTEEISDCLKDTALILHNGKSQTPMQLKGDFKRLANILDKRQYSFSTIEQIEYNRYWLVYQPKENTETVRQHYVILKQLWNAHNIY